MKFRLSVEEHEALSAAAEREGLATGAYAAQAAMVAARSRDRPEYAVFRELLKALMHGSGQVRRLGINMNQAVKAMHAAGDVAELVPLAEQVASYARVVEPVVVRLDEVAYEVSRHLP